MLTAHGQYLKVRIYCYSMLMIFGLTSLLHSQENSVSILTTFRALSRTLTKHHDDLFRLCVALCVAFCDALLVLLRVALVMLRAPLCVLPSVSSVLGHSMLCSRHLLRVGFHRTRQPLSISPVRRIASTFPKVRPLSDLASIILSPLHDIALS